MIKRQEYASNFTIYCTLVKIIINMSILKNVLSYPFGTRNDYDNVDAYEKLASCYQTVKMLQKGSDMDRAQVSEILDIYTISNEFEMVFKLFIGIENEEAVYQAIERLAKDNNLLAEYSLETTQAFYRESNKYLLDFFRLSDNIEDMQEDIKKAKRVMNAANLFYIDYNVKKARVYNKINKLKDLQTRLDKIKQLKNKMLTNEDYREVEVLELEEPLINAKRYIEILLKTNDHDTTNSVDFKTVTGEQLKILRDIYLRCKKFLTDEKNQNGDEATKTQVDNFNRLAEKIIIDIEGAYYQTIWKEVMDLKFDSDIFTLIVEIYGRLAEEGLKSELLHNFDINKLANSILWQFINLIADQCDLNSSFKLISEYLSKCVNQVGKVYGLQHDLFQVDFGSLFQLFTSKILSIAQIIDLDFGLLANLNEFIETLCNYQHAQAHAIKENFEHFVKEIYESKVNKRFYDLILSFNIESYRTFVVGNKPELAGLLKTEKDELDACLNQSDISKCIGYNQYIIDLLSALIISFKDYKACVVYNANIYGPKLIEMTLYILFNAADITNISNDTTIDNRLLCEPSYLKHKLQVLSYYPLSSYHKYKNVKSELTKLSISLLSDNKGLHKELFNISETLKNYLCHDETVKNNRFVRLKARYDHLLLLYFGCKIYEEIKSYLMEKFGTTYKTLEFDWKSKFALLCEMMLVSNDRMAELKDYILRIVQNINLKDDNELYCEMMFDKILKDHDSEEVFQSMYRSKLWTAEFKQLISNIEVQNTTIQIIYVLFSEDAILTPQQLIMASDILERKALEYDNLNEVVKDNLMKLSHKIKEFGLQMENLIARNNQEEPTKIIVGILKELKEQVNVALLVGYIIRQLKLDKLSDTETINRRFEQLDIANLLTI